MNNNNKSSNEQTKLVIEAWCEFLVINIPSRLGKSCSIPHIITSGQHCLYIPKHIRKVMDCFLIKGYPTAVSHHTRKVHKNSYKNFFSKQCHWTDE